MSPKPDLYPLLFEPILKSYIWGGRNLERLLGRRLPDGVIAESWEIAAHNAGDSIVCNGPFSGQSLSTIQSLLGLDLIGRRNAWAHERGKFPLLVKVLDATDKLSVQVHPDDDYALAHEGNELGKTEMWVILHSPPGAEIILGVRRGTSPESFREAIHDGTLQQYLHRISVKAGDFVCVPCGTLHAILDGILIAEIQQNSNTTYRVFDWNRTDNGTPRTLHIDQAMDVIDFDIIEPRLPLATLIGDDGEVQRYLLCRNRYFTTERVIIGPDASFSGKLTGETFEIWGVIEGDIAINGVELDAVRFTLLPASLGDFQAASQSGAICLRTYVADPF